MDVVVIMYSELKSSFLVALPELLEQPYQLLDLVLAGGVIPSARGLVLPRVSLLAASSEAPLHICPVCTDS